MTGLDSDALAKASVMVKPLEWAPYLNNSTWRAKKPFGSSYFIEVQDGLKYYWAGTVFDDLDDAKAAAQANYTARILAALTPVPVSEAVAWRVQNDAGEWHYTTNRQLVITWTDFEKLTVEPLYTSPPASGWNDAIEAAARVAKNYIFTEEAGAHSNQAVAANVASNIADAISALKHGSE